MKLDSSVGCFIVLLSILGGLLIAEPLLQATGLLMSTHKLSPDGDQAMRGILSFGSIIFSIVCVFFGFRSVLFFVYQAIEFFGRPSLSTPQPMIAMTSTICGTVCLLGVLWLECYLAAAGSTPTASAFQTQVVHGQIGNPHIAFHTATATHSSALVLAQSFAGLVFITGSSLISFGIWSSIRRQQ